MKSPPEVKDSAPIVERRPGRPRSVEARRAILKAAHELLTEGGLTSVTIEGIAARAGVGKPTIYRSWPNAHAVAMAALMESNMGTQNAPNPTDRTLDSLRSQLHEVARVFSAPLGRSVALMIAASERETELSKSFRNHFVLARRNEGRSFLTSAIAKGELRNDLDVEVALDLIYAPVFYRLLLGHAPLTPRFIDDVLDTALQGLAMPAGRKP